MSIINSDNDNDSVKDEKAKERTKKYEDMDGFEKIIREAWEGGNVDSPDSTPYF